MDIHDQISRINRANQKGADLEKSIQDWIERSPYSIEAKKNDDSLGWKIFLIVKESPQLEGWGFLFGEAIQQLRSSLDNLIVNVARSHELTKEEDIKKLQFPICDKEEDWNKTEWRVNKLPEKYKTAIKNIQPFNRYNHGGSPDQDLLSVLRDLSNEEKHHLQVKPLVNASQLQHSFLVEFESVEDAAKNIPPNVIIFNPKFKSGEIILKQDVISKIVKIKGNCNISVAIQVDVPHKGCMDIVWLLSALCSYTTAVINYTSSIQEPIQGNGSTRTQF